MLGRMDLKATLLAVANSYCAATDMSKARLATLIANDGKFFDRIEAGGGFTVRTFETGMRWLSAHWPAEHAWPAGIQRPTPATVPAEADPPADPAPQQASAA